MPRPADVADLRQADPVELRADQGIGREFDVIDAEPFDVVDVLAADRRQVARRRRDAEGIKAHLQHANDLACAILSAGDGHDAVPVASPVSVPGCSRRKAFRFMPTLAPISVQEAIGPARLRALEKKARFEARRASLRFRAM